jgi:hypothetical protein
MAIAALDRSVQRLFIMSASPADCQAGGPVSRDRSWHVKIPVALL